MSWKMRVKCSSGMKAGFAKAMASERMAAEKQR